MKIAAFTSFAMRLARRALAGSTFLSIALSVGLTFAQGGAPNPPGNPPQQAQNGAQNAAAQRSNAGAVDKSRPQDVAGGVVARFFVVDQKVQNILGEALPLERAVFGARTPYDRRRRVSAYWDFSNVFARYIMSVNYENDLNACFNGCQLPDATKANLVLLAKQRSESARLAFVQAQYDFDATFGTPQGRVAARSRIEATGLKAAIADNGAIKYVPSTAPSTKFYQTNFNRIAGTRGTSAQASRINASLPYLYEAMQSRANQANLAFLVLKAELASPSPKLFMELDRYYAALSELVSSIISYNKAIAAFAAETVPIYVQGAELLKTLNIDAAPAQNAPANAPANNAPQDDAPQFSFYSGLVLPGFDYDQASFPTALATAPNFANNAFASNVFYLPGFDYDGAAQVAFDDGLLASALASDSTIAGLLTPVALGSQTQATLQNAVESKPTSEPAVSVPAPTPTPVPDPAPATPEPTPAPAATPAPSAQENAAPAEPAASESKPEEKPVEEPKPAEPQPTAAVPASSEPEKAPETAPTAENKPAENAEQPAEKPEEPKPTDDNKPTDAPQPANAEKKEEAAKENESGEQKAENGNIQAAIPQFLPTGYTVPSSSGGTPRELAPIVVFITGFEQPNDAPAEPQPSARFLSDASDNPQDDREPIATPNGTSANVDDVQSRWIVRGQEPDANPAQAPAASVPSTPTRAQAVANYLFKPAQVTDAEFELSLNDALANIRPNARARAIVLRAYLDLQRAALKLNVERAVLTKFQERARNCAPQSESALLCESLASETSAKVAEAELMFRNAQNAALLAAGRRPGAKRPVPTTVPFCGPAFDSKKNADANFYVRRSAPMIQERVASLAVCGNAMPDPSALLDFDPCDDETFAILSLGKKRDLALSFAELVLELNYSIAEYVAYSLPNGATAKECAARAMGK